MHSNDDDEVRALRHAMVKALEAHASTEVHMQTHNLAGAPVDVPLRFSGAVLVVGATRVDASEGDFGTTLMQVGSDDAIVTLVASVVQQLCNRNNVEPARALADVMVRMAVLKEEAGVTVDGDALAQNGANAQQLSQAVNLSARMLKGMVSA